MILLQWRSDQLFLYVCVFVSLFSWKYSFYSSNCSNRIDITDYAKIEEENTNTFNYLNEIKCDTIIQNFDD